MATKAPAKKAPAKKAATKKVAAKPAAKPAASKDYPWLRNRLASSIARSLPEEHRSDARKAFKELTAASDILTAAEQFGFDNTETGLRAFLDTFVAEGVTGHDD